MIAIKKLCSRRGETLIEMLVSIAILSLSIVMMTTMIMTAGKLTESAREKDKAYQDALSSVETYQGTPVSWSVTVRDDTGSVTIQVDGYEDGGFKSYK